MASLPPSLPFDPATGAWRAAPTEPAPPPPDAAKRGWDAMGWHVVLGLDLAALGWVLLASLQAAALQFLHGSGGGEVQMTREVLYQQGWLILFTMGLVPAMWVAATRVRPWAGLVRHLHLERPLRGLWRGAALGFVLLAGLLVLGAVLSQTGADTDNPQAAAVGRVLDWPLAVLLALSAGVGEEVLFRGVLQRWLGWVGQAVLFGLFHASYGTALQVLLPLGLGLLFGWLVRRGEGLWTVMVAHFLYDFAQFAALIGARESGISL